MRRKRARGGGGCFPRRDSLHASTAQPKGILHGPLTPAVGLRSLAVTSENQFRRGTPKVVFVPLANKLIGVANQVGTTDSEEDVAKHIH